MKRRSKSNRGQQQKSGGWHPIGLLIVFAGVTVLIAGVYFIKKDVFGQGVTMGLYGEKYGGGAIDGYGLLFCGMIIFLFGLMIAAPKNKK